MPNDNSAEMWKVLGKRDRLLHNLGRCSEIIYGCPWCAQDIDLVELFGECSDERAISRDNELFLNR